MSPARALSRQRLSGRIFRCAPVNVIAALVIFSTVLSPVPAFTCDDTVLALISGRNPADEFSGSLLVMVRDLQKMASAINAYDVEAAGLLMDSIMSGWLGFTVSYRASPPPNWANDPQWDRRITQISDLLGRLRSHFASDRPKASHDMIEGIATQMTLISTRAAGAQEYDPVLEAEWELLNLNPSLPENADMVALQARISSFTATMHALRADVPTEIEDLYSKVYKSIDGFRRISTNSPVANAPVPIRAYSDLLAAFTRMRTSLLAWKAKSR